MTEILPPGEAIKVLLAADRRASKGRYVSCFRGAPSHTGAYLLSALAEDGYCLARDPHQAELHGWEPHERFSDQFTDLAHATGIEDQRPPTARRARAVLIAALASILVLLAVMFTVLRLL